MLLRKILIALFLLLPVPFILADENGTDGMAAGLEKSVPENQHHGAEGLSPDAPVLIDFGPIAITNSMVVTFIVALGIILVAQMATSEVKLIPSGLQTLLSGLLKAYTVFSKVF